MLELPPDAALAIILFLLTLVIGLGYRLAQRREARPRLVVSGGSGGSIKARGDWDLTRIGFTNLPRFLGMKSDRGTAKIVSARLYDPALKEYVGPPLVWQVVGSSELESACAIDAGERRDLCVFANERSGDEYHVFAPAMLEADVQPQVTSYRDRRKDFAVHLTDNIDRTHRFHFVVENRGVNLNVTEKITLRRRKQLIREAFRLLFEAFSPQR